MELSLFIGWLGMSIAVAVLTYTLGRRESSRPELENLSPRREESDSTFYYRGLSFLLSDEPDKAIEEFTKAVRINSETVEIYLSLGNLFRARGEVGRAIRIHQNIIARPNLPNEVQAAALFALGEDYRQGGFVDRAVEYYRRVLAIDGDHRKAMAGLLALHESEGRWDNAHNILKRLEKVTGKPDPRREAHLLLQLGQEALRRGDAENAEEQFRAAIRVFPGCVEAYRLMGEEHLAKGRVKAAIKSFGALKRTRPSHFFMLLDPLKRAYEEIDEASGFEVCMRDAVASPSASSQLLVRWGEMLHEQGRSDEAIQVLKNGLTKYPNSAEIARLLVKLLADQGNVQEAVTAAGWYLDHMTARQHSFQCGQCGFKSQEIYWKCPQCHNWDTLEPL